MWRPEGFYKLLAEKPSKGENLIEFVADAMLEALKKGGVHRDNQPFDAPPNTRTWVFIPDEEVKDEK